MAEKLLTLQDGQILAVFAPYEWGEWLAYKKAQKEPKPETAVLPIPHLCQYGPGADARKNDCGAACCAMIVRGLAEAEPTVDDIAIRFQQKVNKYMSFGELLAALRFFGLTADYVRPLMAADIEAAIRAGRPVIALVKYPKLPFKFSKFTGSHFIVIYGVDSNGAFSYRDPLDSGSDAEWLLMPDQLEAAMNGFVDGENLPYQGIVVGN